MNVTLTRTGGQAAVSRRILHPLFSFFTASLIGLILMTRTASAETVTNLEAVDINGFSTWTGPFPIVLTGVILNDPSEMLDSTPDFLPWDDGANAYDLGAEWQIFVQTVTPGDRGGVELWIAQDYGNLPWEPHDGSDSYTDDQWTNQVALVSHDPSTGYTFQKGDLVTVTANGSLFYGGMQNINQEHSTDPTYDFSISLVTSNYGVPAAAGHFTFLGHQHQSERHWSLRHFRSHPAKRRRVLSGDACAHQWADAGHHGWVDDRFRLGFALLHGDGWNRPAISSDSSSLRYRPTRRQTSLMPPVFSFKNPAPPPTAHSVTNCSSRKFPLPICPF